MSVSTIQRPEHLDRLIAHAATMGFPHHAELYRAVRYRRITLAQMDRNAVAPTGMLKRSALPTICLLGDDDYASTGPHGWRSVPALLRWAHGAMIHGTGADILSYRLAIDMALECRRFLLIETDSAHLRAWGDALLATRRRVPFIGLRPRDGVHPAIPARKALQ